MCYGVRASRQLEGHSSSGLGRFEGLRDHALRLLEAVNSLQVWSRHDLALADPRGRAVTPHDFQFAGLGQVAIQNEQGGRSTFWVKSSSHVEIRHPADL